MRMKSWMICIALSMAMAACPQDDAIVEVLEVVSTTGFVNGEVVDDGARIDSGALLATDDTGRLSLRFLQDAATCVMLSGSTVTVGPASGVLFSNQQGETWCEVGIDRNAGEGITVDAPGQRIRTERGRFSVEVAGDEIGVETQEGMVSLTPHTGEAPTEVREGLRAVIDRDGDGRPILLMPLELEPSDHEAIRTLSLDRETGTAR